MPSNSATARARQIVEPRGRRGGVRRLGRQLAAAPTDSVTSAPARLPLSTVET